MVGTYVKWLLYKAAQMSTVLKPSIRSAEPKGNNLYVILPPPQQYFSVVCFIYLFVCRCIHIFTAVHICSASDSRPHPQLIPFLFSFKGQHFFLIILITHMLILPPSLLVLSIHAFLHLGRFWYLWAPCRSTTQRASFCRVFLMGAHLIVSLFASTH